MKKIFEKPAIYISVFSTENIVTGSSGVQSVQDILTSDNNTVIMLDEKKRIEANRIISFSW